MNEPRRILFAVISENHRSTRFNQELEVGVKKVKGKKKDYILLKIATILIIFIFIFIAQRSFDAYIMVTTQKVPILYK